jgi:hypothetical protein
LLPPLPNEFPTKLSMEAQEFGTDMEASYLRLHHALQFFSTALVQRRS